MSKIIAGLDIGTSKICIVIGIQSQYDHHKLEVLGIGETASDGIVRGMIVNIDKAAVAIQRAIHAAEEDSGIHINVVNVDIAGKHLVSTCHHGSITRDTVEQEITVADIHKLTNDMYRTVTPPGTAMIHAMPQEYTIDYDIVTEDPVGMSGIKLEANFHMITAKTHAIQNMHKCMKKVGIETDVVMASALASSLSVLSDDEKKAGVCLVDFGASLMNIVIFTNALIRYSAAIPLGSHIITADIQQGCMVMEEQAELLKIKFGELGSKDVTQQALITVPGMRNRGSREISIQNLGLIIQARVEELVEFIHQEMLCSGYYEKLVAGVVLTGGGANLKGMNEYMQAITGLDTRIGTPIEYIEESSSKAVSNPSYASAVGLTLAGFKPLDYREAYYKYAQASRLDLLKSNVKKTKKRYFSFSNIMTKAKAFLVDDYEEK